MRRLITSVALALALGAWQASAAFGADSIYWGNYGNNTISFANLDDSGGGGQLNTTGATPSSPEGVAIDPAADKIYWINVGNDTISFANLDGSGGGGQLNTTGTTPFGPVGMAVYPAAGKVYWANQANNTISFANLDDSGGGGQLNITGATADHPSGVAVDPAAGKIYWANFGNNTISFANLNNSGGGGQLSTAGASPSEPFGVAVDPAVGKIYWANGNGNTISFANLDDSGGGGQLNTTGATLSGPEGVAVDPAAGKVYWANFGNSTISFANLDDSGGGGQLNTTGATPSSSVFPVLLEVPAAAGAPAITGGGSTVGSTLTCGQGTWGADLLASFLYRAPRSFSYRWTFNGADIVGATSSSYTAPAGGSYACRVTASNQAGSTSQTSASFTVTGSGIPPITQVSLNKVSQSHRRWREGNGLPHIASVRPPVGTTFRFTLNEAAKVRLVFKQRLPGRRVGGRCLAPTATNHSKPKCTRLVGRGSLSFSVKAGSHRLRFQGRLSKHKRLPLGRYALVITATNSAGQHATAKLDFTIVK